MVIYLAKAPAGAKKALSFASWHITNEFTLSLNGIDLSASIFSQKKPFQACLDSKNLPTFAA